MPPTRRRRRWALLAATAVAGLLFAASNRNAPGSLVTPTGTAQPVRFVGEPDAPGGVWFLTVAEKRLAPLERAIGRDEPEVVRNEAVSQFAADGDFRQSQSMAREVAARLDPAATVVVRDGVVGVPGLQSGDRLVAVAGQPVAGVRHAAALLDRRRWGDDVLVTIDRAGERRHATVPGDGDGDDRNARRVRIPLARVPSAAMPTIGDVRGGWFHGASAGLAFALAQVDRLSGGAIVAGRTVAATGVLADSAGTVGEVAGVDRKVRAAVAAGATVIFVPAANVGDVPEDVGVPVVGVREVRDAIQWLCARPTGPDCGPWGELVPSPAWDGRWRAVTLPVDDLEADA